MAKWHEHSASPSGRRHPVPMPSNGSSTSSCAVGAGRPLLHRVRSGSLNALDKPPMMRSPPSPSTPAEEDEDDDEMGEAQQQQRESMTSVMAAAAMAIPQFRSCHASSSKVANNANNNQAYGEWRIRRRGRSVSDNSSSSTSSLSSLSSSSSSSNMSNPNGRPSLHQLSADVSAFRSGSMDSDDSMDGSLGFGSVVVAPALPRPPYPVDPYHFYCKPQVSAGSLLSDMTTLLNDCDVEYSVHAYKCKFKCVKYVHYSHVEFIVRVYSHQNALLVEFQRRSGSLLLWDGLYNILYHKLVDVVDPSASACSQSGGQKKVGAVRRDSLSAQIWRTISNQTPSSGVEAMKIMLTSKYVDAQREGCSGLAVLTEDAQSSYLVAKHDLVGGLVSAAESDDQDMARCAVGALANIANAIGSFANQEIADDTVAHVTRAAKIVAELLAKTPSDTRFSLELLRECARALCAFGKICAQQIMDCEGHTQLLQLVNHRDAQLAAHCRDALQTLQLNV